MSYRDIRFWSYRPPLICCTLQYMFCIRLIDCFINQYLISEQAQAPPTRSSHCCRDSTSPLRGRSIPVTTSSNQTFSNIHNKIDSIEQLPIYFLIFLHHSVSRAQGQVKFIVPYGWTHAWITVCLDRTETKVRVGSKVNYN